MMLQPRFYSAMFSSVRYSLWAGSGLLISCFESVSRDVREVGHGAVASDDGRDKGRETLCSSYDPRASKASRSVRTHNCLGRFKRLEDRDVRMADGEDQELRVVQALGEHRVERHYERRLKGAVSSDGVAL